MGNINLDLANHTSTTDSSFSKILNSSGIYDRRTFDWFNKFNRFGYMDPYNILQNTREYIFFTKPDLHIFNASNAYQLNEELTNNPIFVDAMDRYKDILMQLQYSVNSPRNAFVNILTNTVKSSLDLPSINTNDVNTSENIYGTFMSYRRSSLTSDDQHEFSLEFEDDKYLNIYMWFRLYDEYCKLKDLGMVSPPNKNYIINKILHDQMAVFKIIVGEDGETIIYWCKLWGVYPKNVPREAFSDLSGNNSLRMSVTFKSQFVEDMTPTILGGLNTITLDNGRTIPQSSDILPLYNREIGMMEGDWAGVPFVVRDTNVTKSNAVYKLKWRRS